MNALRSFTLGAPKVCAAPTGGALLGRWGRAVAFISLLSAPMAWAEQVSLPSGLDVTFHDTLRDDAPDGAVWRFRFVAPSIAGGALAFDDAAQDMTALCAEYALPQLIKTGEVAQRIVVTLMEKPVEFGVMAPDVTQYFESYTVENGTCIWEVF